MNDSIPASSHTAVRPSRRLLSEPLLQFLLAGCVLLLTQRACGPVQSAAGSEERIVVSAQTLATLRSSFEELNRRLPSEAELAEIIDGRIDEEVLYREAVRVGIDRYDPIVRRQLQQKMRFLIEDLAPQPEPTREELQAWLDAHPARYAQPEAISFEQVFLSRARHGKRLPNVAVDILESLRSQPDEFRQLGDPFPAGAIITAADQRRLEKDFGSNLTQAIFDQPQGQWSQPLRSSLGLHIVRITQREPSSPVSVEQAGQRLITDFKQDRREQANSRALQKLRARYVIEIEAAS